MLRTVPISFRSTEHILLLTHNYQMSNVGCRMSDGESRMSDVECRMSDVGCQMSDVECRMSDVECRMAPINFRIRNMKNVWKWAKLGERGILRGAQNECQAKNTVRTIWISNRNFRFSYVHAPGNCLIKIDSVLIEVIKSKVRISFFVIAVVLQKNGRKLSFSFAK